MSGPFHPTGRGRVSSTSPRALAVCQRCGFTWNRTKLTDQQQWGGNKLQALNLWVCPPCLDVPQIQLRSIIIPPDPVPVYLPFPEPYSAEVNSDISTESLDDLGTETGDFLVMEIGNIPGT